MRNWYVSDSRLTHRSTCWTLRRSVRFACEGPCDETSPYWALWGFCQICCPEWDDMNRRLRAVVHPRSSADWMSS